jgi:hypothetical protein
MNFLLQAINGRLLELIRPGFDRDLSFPDIVEQRVIPRTRSVFKHLQVECAPSADGTRNCQASPPVPSRSRFFNAP